MKIRLTESDPDGLNWLGFYHAETGSPAWSVFDNALDFACVNAHQLCVSISRKYPFYQCTLSEGREPEQESSRDAIIAAWKAGDLTKEQMVERMKRAPR